jgi:anti-sigma B factor antagonist
MSGPSPDVAVERRDGGRTVVTVRGEIDLANAEVLERYVDEAAEGTDALVVDLTDVTYLDSRGLRILVQLAARHRDGTLTVTVVAGRDGVVGRLLEMTRRGEVVPVREDLP